MKVAQHGTFSYSNKHSPAFAELVTDNNVARGGDGSTKMQNKENTNFSTSETVFCTGMISKMIQSIT